MAIRLQWPQAEQERPNSRQIQILERTLQVLPLEHLQRFVQSNGYIRASGPNCPPLRGGGYWTNPSWIRLSHASWSSSHNQKLHFTFLHEFGHWVDWAYGAFRTLQQRAPEEAAFLAAAYHRGRTQFAGERFADCYAIFVHRYLGHFMYNHSKPEDYKGEAGRRRFLALFLTPAFANLQHLRNFIPASP